MATSRTGTATYLRNRKRVLAKAKRDGLTECPGYERHDGSHRNCGRTLDYNIPLLDASAETDHVLEHRHGGTDDTTNLRVLCRACNRERNNQRIPIQLAGADAFPVSAWW